MAKRSLLSRCTSYVLSSAKPNTIRTHKNHDTISFIFLYIFLYINLNTQIKEVVSLRSMLMKACGQLELQIYA